MDIRGLSFERTELVERIAQARHAVIHGPAGYGKSHLLQEVTKRLGDNAVYFSAAQFDGDIPLGKIFQRAPANKYILLDEPQTFVTEFADQTGPADSLYAPAARLIIATRSLDSLPIARLRMEGGLELVGPEKLRIDSNDIVNQCTRAVGRCAALQIAKWSEGWCAAILLLTDWLANPNNEIDDQGSFVARSGISAYIDQEILAALPLNWIRAMMFAGLVDGCDRELLDAMRPEEDLGRHLFDIVSRVEGLTVLNGERLFLHPLLREHFLRRFEGLPRTERSEVLANASRACDALGRIPEAARLATKIGGGPAVLDYLSQAQGLKLWLTGGFDVIKMLVEQAGPTALASEPRLRLLQCVVHVKEGSIGDAEALFAECMPLLQDDSEGLRDAEVIRTTMLIYGCRAATEKDLESFNRIVLHNNDDTAWKAYITTLRCILSIQAGELERAIAYLAEASSYSRDTGSEYNLVFLDIHHANIELARGEIAAARELLKNARKASRQKFPGDLGLETVLSAITAYLEFEAGRLSSARAHLRKSAHRMPHAEAWFDVYSAAYEPYARLLVQEAGLQAALGNLEAQKAQLLAQDLPRIADFADYVGKCLAGEAWLRGRPNMDLPRPVTVPVDFVAWQERELVMLANAYAFLADNDPAGARDLLASMIDDARERGLHRSEVRGLLLLTATYDRLGETDAASASFEMAVALAADHGTSRAFAEFGGDSVARRIREMLSDETRRGDAPQLFRSLHRWFGDHDSEGAAARFTPRERDVLDALDQGGSDKLVGRRLGISEHGVRFHLKNIYRKLRVHDRVDALAKARATGEL